MDPQYRVLLVEDDPTTRGRLARVIDGHPRLRLLAAVGSCEAARRELQLAQPDVLLTDLDLPDGSGIDLIREIGDRTAAMVITIFGDEQHVVAAIQAGALGYLLKDGDADYIGSSILEMLAGGSPISPPIARYLLRRLREPPREVAQGEAHTPPISEREQEVLRLIVKGFTYAEIAGIMHIATTTVASHVRSIYRKLDVTSRGEAAYEAIQLGLVKM